MSIDVREVMTGESTRYFVAKRKADPKRAFQRIEMLQAMLEDIRTNVNAVAVGDTEESWKDAYERLNTAFQSCIAEEKIIVVNA